MSAELAAKVRINLERAVVVVVDNALGLDILSTIFLGFGVRNLHRCRSVAEAHEVAKAYQIDLVVMDNLMGAEDVYDFVQSLRRAEGDDNRFAPVVLLSAHTGASIVSKARDSGANFLIGKPISAKVLLERILWVAREKRQFLETDNFAGPDRRFHDLGPPDGTVGRRRGDPTEAEDDTSSTMTE